MNTTLGKNAEAKIKQWLNRPEEGYDFNRIPDQMTGFYGSSNICDFTLYKSPTMYYLESKATWHDRFEFSVLTPTQHDGMLRKSQIQGVECYVVVLFATSKRAFLIPIQEIKRLEDMDRHSLNINKIAKWDIEYKEIKTIPNNRKVLLDYDHVDNVL